MHILKKTHIQKFAVLLLCAIGIAAVINGIHPDAAAHAYTCQPPKNADASNEWAYDPSTGQCYRIDYAARQYDAKPGSNGQLQCGNEYEVQMVHEGNKTVCKWWERTGDKKQVGEAEVLNNDGSRLNDNNIACTQGDATNADGAYFKFIPGRGCIWTDKNGVPSSCDPGMEADGKGHCIDVSSSNVGRVIPKNKDPSADTTAQCNKNPAMPNDQSARSGVCSCPTIKADSGQCVDTGDQACSLKYPIPPSLASVQAACKAGANGKDCNTYQAQAEKDACQAGAKYKQQADSAAANNPSNAANGGGTAQSGQKCGSKLQFNILPCSDECKKVGDSSGASGVQCIGSVLKLVLSVLTVIIGIVAVAGIGYAATLYASAEDNSGQISKAKGIIRDVIIGLVLYGFMVAIIGWLVPDSGLFGSPSGSDSTSQTVST